MTQLHTFEASQPNLAERFGAISSAFSDNFGPASQVRPVGDKHRPVMMNWAYADGVTLHNAQMSPLFLEKRATRPRRPSNYLIWHADQASQLSLEGKPPLHLLPDEVIILTAAMAKAWRVPRDFTTSCLIIDKHLVDQYLPRAPDLLARRLSFPFGLDTVLHTLLESSWAASSAGRFEDVGPHLARAILETLSAVAPREDQNERSVGENHLRIRCAQARTFIEKHYSRTDLSIAAIADHLQLSPRYVQLAFKSDRTTPSEYLRSCRLSASARLLRDPARKNRSITEIAFACGFNSAPHFSNEFKRTYGVSPRGYRASADCNAGPGFAKPDCLAPNEISTAHSGNTVTTHSQI